MSTIQPDNFIDKLLKYIKQSYEERAKEIVDKHKIKMGEELDSLMDELVTKTALKLENMVEINSFGNKLTISIIKEKK